LLAAAAALGLAFALVVAGCAADNATKQNLQAGYAALEAQRFDEAVGRADQQLSRAPQGPGSADALYLKGRAIEQRVKANPAQARADLQQARHCYLEALNQRPSRTLDAYLLTSLANIDYAEEDYAAALTKWSEVFSSLDNADVKSWVLYRVGLCQQRLGQFDAADRTFASVVDQYPRTLPAERARQHMGHRAFTVQVATFEKPQAAESAMQELRREGAVPTRVVDASGHHIVTIGPAANYAQARQLVSRFASRYPHASIVP
jgi:tetratricopeptide (TPR) repeat protein